ncbi:MAG: substrate-binding domain-containing protein [Thermoflavifilum sp.]|nr:substrate-binding domain-containing protein [Thermoflavifilum sp.]
MIRGIIIIFVIVFLQNISYAQQDTVFVYGPGGPYPAIKEAAFVFSKENKVTVQVIAGPVSKWEKDAKENADIIYSGDEFMMTDFTRRFNIENETITPLYLRKSGLLVRPGNPKNIQSFSDILKPNIRVMVVTGSGLIGVWEDMVGKTKSIDSLKMLKRNIVFYAANSGIAKNEWINNKKIDVWITWNIWQISNPHLADFVPVEEKFTIYRDCAVALTTKGEKNKIAIDFFNFLKSREAKPIFKKWGWITE